MNNILITGGCGFIGSNFINYMADKYREYKFINIDALYYSASKDNIIQKENYILVEENITNLEKIKIIFQKYNPKIIFHFAAQSHVDGSFENPIQYVQDNILGTVTLLEIIRILKLKTIFFHISTDEVYGETSIEAVNENSLLLPTNPYSASKAGAEMMLYSYGKSFNQKYYIVRGNNVYGEKQYHEKLIPKFIKLLKEDKKCTIHGNGLMKRSFVHVIDFIKAVELIWLKGNIGEIYNIGSSDEISVLDVSKKIINIIKNKNNKDDIDYDDYDDYIDYIEDRNFNDCRYLITFDKLLKLGWRQTIKFDDGLKKLIGKKWLIYGVNGWIGGMFYNHLNWKYGGNARCDNSEELYDEILKTKPDIVLCAIGRTHGEGCNNIDYLEDKPEINQRDNYSGPLNIFKFCEKLNIPCVYIGTGCIFEYDEKHIIGGRGFTDKDDPNFFGSSYSRVKAGLDLETRKFKNVLNCRIRMPITKESNPHNFIDKIKKYPKICNVPNSMTFLDEAIPEIIRLGELGRTGTINVVNPGTLTHKEILDKLNCTYELIDKEELEKNLVIGKRSNNFLITSECLNLTPIKNLLDNNKLC